MKNNSFIVLAENNSDRIIVSIEKKSNSWTVLASQVVLPEKKENLVLPEKIVSSKRKICKAF